MHVSRLSAMGAMAAALAHELNQPLTATANFANAAQRLLGTDVSHHTARLEDARQAMAEAADEAIRAGQIVRHLRELVSRGDGEKLSCSLNTIVEASAALAASGAGKASHYGCNSRPACRTCWWTECKSNRSSSTWSATRSRQC